MKGGIKMIESQSVQLGEGCFVGSLTTFGGIRRYGSISPVVYEGYRCDSKLLSNLGS
jgi:hypothetical protein